MSEERELTMGAAIREALHDEMERDSTVIVMGEDVVGGAGSKLPDAEDCWGGLFGITGGLVGKYGRNRIRDTPISEAGFIGAAIGAAATGLRPVAALMFVDFFGIPMDQIFNQGAKIRYMFGGKAKVPVVIRAAIGGGNQRRGAALSMPLLRLRAYPRIEGCGSLHAVRCQGIDDGSHSR